MFHRITGIQLEAGEERLDRQHLEPCALLQPEQRCSLLMNLLKSSPLYYIHRDANSGVDSDDPTWVSARWSTLSGRAVTTSPQGNPCWLWLAKDVHGEQRWLPRWRMEAQGSHIPASFCLRNAREQLKPPPPPGNIGRVTFSGQNGNHI